MKREYLIINYTDNNSKIIIKKVLVRAMFEKLVVLATMLIIKSNVLDKGYKNIGISIWRIKSIKNL